MSQYFVRVTNKVYAILTVSQHLYRHVSVLSPYVLNVLYSTRRCSKETLHVDLTSSDYVTNIALLQSFKQ